MKIILKWVSVFVLPSIFLFLYLYNDFVNTSDQSKAIFLTLHFFFAGGAIFFTLREVKRKSIENVSAFRYIMTGIFVSVTHAVLFGLFSGLYFNFINTNAKQDFIDEVLVKVVVNNRDSAAYSMDEYYDNLMEGKDSGILVPEVYKQYQMAAMDSLALAKEEVVISTEQSFGLYYVILRWVMFAPIYGIFFSVVITVFIVKR